MQNLSRILAVIVMVISALVLVLSLTGIAGAWIVRGQLATDLVDIATEAEARATRAKRGLNRRGAVGAEPGAGRQFDAAGSADEGDPGGAAHAEPGALGVVYAAVSTDAQKDGDRDSKGLGGSLLYTRSDSLI
jgi:hypothetical protein